MHIKVYEGFNLGQTITLKCVQDADDCTLP